MSKVKDMTGMRFGKLLVIGFGWLDSHQGAYWKCQCDCGRQSTTRGSRLRIQGVQSCGCEKGRKKVLTDTLIGRRFGRLTVLELNPGRQNWHKVYRCRCDCGRITDVVYPNLWSGSTKSCGCLLEECRQRHRRKWNFPPFKRKA